MSIDPLDDPLDEPFEDEDLPIDSPDDLPPEPLVCDCGYPGCCMPGYHFASECHSAEDIIAVMALVAAEREEGSEKWHRTP